MSAHAVNLAAWACVALLFFGAFLAGMWFGSSR